DPLSNPASCRAAGSFSDPPTYNGFRESAPRAPCPPALSISLSSPRPGSSEDARARALARLAWNDAARQVVGVISRPRHGVIFVGSERFGGSGVLLLQAVAASSVVRWRGASVRHTPLATAATAAAAMVYQPDVSMDVELGDVEAFTWILGSEVYLDTNVSFKNHWIKDDFVVEKITESSFLTNENAFSRFK
ncbi:Protein of unknown function, partial [Gryllus bimaculatus]